MTSDGKRSQTLEPEACGRQAFASVPEVSKSERWSPLSRISRVISERVYGATRDGWLKQFLQDAHRRVSFPMAYRHTPRPCICARALSYRLDFPFRPIDSFRSTFKVHADIAARGTRFYELVQMSWRVLSRQRSCTVFLLHASSKRSRLTNIQVKPVARLFLAKREKGRSVARSSQDRSGQRWQREKTLSTANVSDSRSNNSLERTSYSLLFPFNASPISTSVQLQMSSVNFDSTTLYSLATLFLLTFVHWRLWFPEKYLRPVRWN